MVKIAKCLLFLCVLGTSFAIQAQSQRVKELFEEAEQFDDARLYGECLQKLDGIIKISQRKKNQTSFLRASIMKAETFRKTERFSRGITILKELKNTRKYPELHVKKLGRMAAIYRQDGAVPEDVKNDTVLKILNEGIKLSKRFEILDEEASLRNELGYMQSQQAHDLVDMGAPEKADVLFRKAGNNLNIAAEIFRKLGDLENELWVMRNIMAMQIWMGDFVTLKKTYPKVVAKLEGTEWYQLQSVIYELIGHLKMSEGDSLRGYEWYHLANGATAAFHAKMNSSQMAAFTNLHDTERFKKEAIEKQAALDRQQYELNQYVYFSIILLLILALGIVILVRERRLKRKMNRNVKDLNVLNDKYEMLIVESNHRIKNNLQMIISMLEFTKKGIEHSRTDIIRSISGKIQTISALHKHLYVDMHNEFVDLKFYFNELIEQYRQMEVDHSIKIDIDDIQIRSERIVYFGLILNEMLSNTIEHSKNKEEAVTISVKSAGDNWIFEYCDYSKHDDTSQSGTGLQLIRGLVKRIGGTAYKLDRETGKYQFTFDTGTSKSMMAS